MRNDLRKLDHLKKDKLFLLLRPSPHSFKIKGVAEERFRLKNGFSIIEVLIALFIISLGLVGLLSLVQMNIRVNYINKNTVLAAQLAQEGLELMRKMRDSNWINEEDGDSVGWDLNMAAGTYIVDYNDDLLSPLSPSTGINDNNAILKINSDGFYEHTNGVNSQFRRVIVIDDKQADSFRITSIVSYQKEGRSFDYTATDYLYNWYR